MGLNSWNFNPNNYNFSNMMVHSKRLKINPPKLAWWTIICTWFYVGFIPIATGTLGSLAIYPLYNFIIRNATATPDQGLMPDILFKFWICFIITFVFGWMAITKFQKETGTFDHNMIVIDEVVGMFFALAISFDWAVKASLKLNDYFHFSKGNLAFMMVFVIFRYFDIRKPFFISTIDDRFKNPVGVLADDVAAGGFTALVIYIIYSITNYI